MANQHARLLGSLLLLVVVPAAAASAATATSALFLLWRSPRVSVPVVLVLLLGTVELLPGLRVGPTVAGASAPGAPASPISRAERVRRTGSSVKREEKMRNFSLSTTSVGKK